MKKMLLAILMMLLCFPAFAGTDWTADADCRFAFKFEESSGNPVSLCGSSTPSASNITYSTAGKYGDDFSFNGTDSEVELISDIGDVNGDTAITVAAWVNVDTDDGLHHPILNLGDNASFNYIWQLVVNYETSEDRYEVFCKTTSTFLDMRTADNSADANIGTYVHVAYTSDGSGNKLYIGGSLQSPTYDTGSSSTSCEFSSVYNAANDNFKIGGRDWAGIPSDAFFGGDIDEFIIIAQVLTEAEIQTMMTCGIDNANCITTSLEGASLSGWTLN